MMFRRIATFWVVLALQLVVSSGCKSKREAPAKEESPAPLHGLAAIPDNVVAVIGIDVAALASTDVARRAVTQVLEREPALRKTLVALLEECSLEPGKSIKQILLGLGAADSDAVMVVSGQFSEAALAACVGKHVSELGGGLTADSSGPRKLYRANSGPERNEIWFAFASTDTVVAASSKSWLLAAVGNGAKVSANKEMQVLLARAPKKAELWAVAQVPEQIGSGLKELVGAKAPYRSIVAHMTFAGGLEVALALEMADEEDAKLVESTGKRQLEMASLVAQKMGLGQLVNRIELRQDGKIASLSLTLTEAELEEILAQVNRTIDREAPDEQNPGSH